jgi:hypothetical protein
MILTAVAVTRSCASHAWGISVHEQIQSERTYRKSQARSRK